VEVSINSIEIRKLYTVTNQSSCRTSLQSYA